MAPHALVVEWLETVAGDAPRPWIGDTLDPRRGFPQLVVTHAAVGVAQRRDGRLDDAFYTVNAGVTAYAPAAARYGYTPAWDALTPVIDGLVALSTGHGPGVTLASGERIESAVGVVVTEDVDPDSRQAQATVTFRFRVRRA